MKKKGIQLSINFLVMLTLSIVTLLFGMYFLSKIVDISSKQIGNIPSQDELALNSCMNEGIAVCLSKNKAALKPGKYEVLWLGVQNDLPDSEDFVYNLYLGKGIKPDGTEMTETQRVFKKQPPGCYYYEYGSLGPFTNCVSYEWVDIPIITHAQDNWVATLTSNPFLIDKGDNLDKHILFQVIRGAKSGTYVWDLKICTDADTGKPDYDSAAADFQENCPKLYPNQYGSLHKIYITVP